MAVERSNPSALANPPGYSHVVKDGKTIYVAGQLSRNSAGETVGEGNFSAQAEQAFKNVQAALESVGSDMHHIDSFPVLDNMTVSRRISECGRVAPLDCHN